MKYLSDHEWNRSKQLNTIIVTILKQDLNNSYKNELFQDYLKILNYGHLHNLLANLSKINN